MKNKIIYTGFYKLHKYCIDCGKEKAINEHKRCYSCSKKGIHSWIYKKKLSKSVRDKISKTLKNKIKNGEIIPVWLGKKFNKKHLKNMSNAHKGHKLTQRIINKMKKALQKHHIDLNGNNNKKDNIMYLNLKKHRQLHSWAYRYLLLTGQINKYIKWFLKNNRKELQ